MKEDKIPIENELDYNNTKNNNIDEKNSIDIIIDCVIGE